MPTRTAAARTLAARSPPHYPLAVRNAYRTNGTSRGAARRRGGAILLLTFVLLTFVLLAALSGSAHAADSAAPAAATRLAAPVPLPFCNSCREGAPLSTLAGFAAATLGAGWCAHRRR